MNRTILLTGATDGIGKLTAIKLANEGHRLLLHGRNPKKLEDVISIIKTQTKNQDIKAFISDFSDLKAVKKMAGQILDEIPSIDIIINNAGVYKSVQTTNEDGIDLRFVVNYLSPYLLTELLMPILKKGNAPRIINLSSAAQAKVSLEALEGKKSLTIHEAYSQSKLALSMWSLYLAERETEIVVIPVNPGSLLDTRMVREGFGRIWSPADKGAQILYDLALLKKYKDASGRYFDNDLGGFGTLHPDGLDRKATIELIEVTQALLNNILHN